MLGPGDQSLCVNWRRSFLFVFFFHKNLELKNIENKGFIHQIKENNRNYLKITLMRWLCTHYIPIWPGESTKTIFFYLITFKEFGQEFIKSDIERLDLFERK